MERQAFTVRADPSLVARLDREARRQDRTRSYLVEQAIKAYLAGPDTCPE